MEMALIEIDGFTWFTYEKWVDFPWQTVNVISRYGISH